MTDVAPPLDLTRLRAEYGAFLRPGRVLLTGHSHQAWPDRARRAQAEYFDDAAAFVDDKWGRAVFPRCESVAARVLARMGFDEGDALAFGSSTHELVFRLLTAVAWRGRPRVVTTTGEFHSLFRQLSRLAEEGVEVVWVDASDRATLADRLCEATTPGTALVAVSAVFFEDASVLPGLGRVVARAAAVGALPLVDAYHAFNVVPLDYGPAGERAYVTAGGYKYAAFGEGVCWLRLPRDCALRPVDTGWYADFASIADPRRAGAAVGYGAGGARFAGATFDASAIYRADAALTMFDEFGLSVERLRAISLAQTGRIIDAVGASRPAREGRLTLATSRDPTLRGGFVAFRTPHAAAVVDELRLRGVYVDSRGDLVRIGPAPYLSDDEIDEGTRAFVDVVEAIGG